MVEEEARLSAAYWRERAAEILITLESVKDPESRATLLRIAHDYTRLAERAEQREKGS